MKGKWTRLLAAAALASVLTLSGCMSDGDDGAPGADGADGIDGIDGTNGTDGTDGTDGVDATADPALYADLESCNVCHGVVGDMHQAEYNKYAGAVANSVFDLEILSVTSAPIAGGYAGTMTVHIDMDGVPYTGALGDLAQARFYTVQYDSTATDGVYFTNSTSFSCVNDCSIGGGDFELTTSTTSVPTVDPLPEVGMAYGYVADGLLDTEGMRLYENVSNDTLLFGAIDYDSPANVEGCETCHGSPYLKHGYRAAALADTGVADFAACKACHYDDREGGHGEWQWMVDDPYAWATGALDKAEVKAAYPYTANVMNDVHMSHAMEFPYPQSMANCVTCHAGKLDRATADDKFTLETCKSCHPITGTDAWPGEEYAQPKRAPAMTYLWSVSNFPSHNLAMDCQDCHNGQVAYPTFAELHSGYDARITDASDGVKWAEKYTASIDSIDVTDNVVTVEFSVSDADMVPYIYLSFYGYDTKQMIVASHTRGIGPMCGSRACRYEAKPDDTNALFEFTPDTLGNTSYTAVMDLSLYETEVVSDIPTLIDEGVIKTGIVTIAPRYELADEDGTDVGLDAVIMNFDVSDGTEVANYFTGTDTTVENAKCEVCHDKLAVTFHSGSGRSTVEACRNCHVTTSPGGHVEMQSRSIDSYAHAIHSFQAFDTGEVFNTCLLDEVTGECAEDANGDEIPIADFDPVRAARFDLHIEHTFPNFTILNCEACHTAGTYNPADQSMSMPGVSSAADMPLTWYEKIESGRNDPWSPSWVEDASGRNIGAVPEYVTGPSSRACGGCHRAEFINEDAAGALAAFNGHTDMGGTLVENDEDDVALYAIIEKIMSIF